jgi:hypothetical protein
MMTKASSKRYAIFDGIDYVNARIVYCHTNVAALFVTEEPSTVARKNAVGI